MEREVAEETGLVVRAGALLGRVELPAPGGGRYDIRDYACRAVGGTLRAGTDASEVVWADLATFRSLPTVPGLAGTLSTWEALPRR